MRTVLIGAVDFNKEHFFGQHFDCVIAVDAGWKTCVDCGVHADVALGDFDSLGYGPSDVPVVRFPSVKDESDMEIALAHAASLGTTEAVIYGAFSGRIDHTLANFQIMERFSRNGMKTVGIGSDFAAVVLAHGANVDQHAPSSLAFCSFDPHVLGGSYAPYFSLFALSGPAKGVSIHGLAYELSDHTLLADYSLGLSNQFCGKEAEVEVGEGVVLALFPLDALSFMRIA
ncbi:MAG: thiamine diphosphokinase [Eggerthellaceae bacterium]|nr:thiamine diphosphokinase [Eggerthellaceae bacterium]